MWISPTYQGNRRKAGLFECMGRAGPSSGHQVTMPREWRWALDGCGRRTSARQKIFPGRRTFTRYPLHVDQRGPGASYQAGVLAGVTPAMFTTTPITTPTSSFYGRRSMDARWRSNFHRCRPYPQRRDMDFTWTIDPRDGYFGNGDAAVAGTGDMGCQPCAFP